MTTCVDEMKRNIGVGDALTLLNSSRLRARPSLETGKMGGRGIAIKGAEGFE